VTEVVIQRLAALQPDGGYLPGRRQEGGLGGVASNAGGQTTKRFSSAFSIQKGEQVSELYDIPNGRLKYIPGFIEQAEADRVFKILHSGVPWESHSYNFGGKIVPIPVRFTPTRE
jgi:hypothetical protein